MGESGLDDFETLAASIQRAFPASRLERLTEVQIAEIRCHYPVVPHHYLDFLRWIGWGSLGSSLMLYSGLCKPGDFFDAEIAVQLFGILFLGDNLGGWMVGFDARQDWRLVGVDCGSLDVEPLGFGSLGEFIAQRVADR